MQRGAAAAGPVPCLCRHRPGDQRTRRTSRSASTMAWRTARARETPTRCARLESIAPYPGDAPITRERIIIARKWPQFYGGLTAYREESDYFFQRAAPVAGLRRAADRCAINAGQRVHAGPVAAASSCGWTSQRRAANFPIPVVMFMGRHDYTTPSRPTAAWLATGAGAVQAGRVVRAFGAHDPVGGAGQDARQPAGARAAAGGGGRSHALNRLP